MRKMSSDQRLREAWNEFDRLRVLLPRRVASAMGVVAHAAVAHHADQLKLDMYPYGVHCLSVYNYLLGRLGCVDQGLLAASLLHDVTEDCGVSQSRLRREYGRRVQRLVAAVSRPVNGKETEEIKERQRMAFFRQVVCQAGPEAQLLGCADKLDTLRGALLLPPDSPHRPKLRRWLREAELFLPLAKELHPLLYEDLRNAIAALRQMADNDLAERLRSGSKPTVLLICGMPGTRKSTTAVKVGAALKFSTVVGMDEVRDVLRLGSKKTVLGAKSHECWRLYGRRCTNQTFRLGFMAHCRALIPGARAVINKNTQQGESTLVEGVHVLPSLYRNIRHARVIHVLLTVATFEEHRLQLDRKFRRRHGRQKPWDDEKVRRLERIQDILLQEADQSNVAVIASVDPVSNCHCILDIVDDLTRSETRSRPRSRRRRGRR